MRLASLTIIISLVVFPSALLAEESPIEDSPYEAAETFDPIPLDAGETVPVDGVLIDEAMAADYILGTAAETRLRTELEVRMAGWTRQTAIYETALTELQSQVQTLTESILNQEESWWDRHGGVVLGTIGFIVGAALTVLIAWIVVEAIQPVPAEG
jgi:hypothetical protein